MQFESQRKEEAGSFNIGKMKELSLYQRITPKSNSVGWAKCVTDINLLIKWLIRIWKKKKPKIRGYAAREKGRKGLVLFRNQKGVVKGNRLLTHPCFGFLPNFIDAVKDWHSLCQWRVGWGTQIYIEISIKTTEQAVQ